MIKITFNPNTYALDVKGHAMTAPKGQDIVCAAISALVGALAYTIESNDSLFRDKPDISLEEGKAYICCRPKPQYMNTVSTIYVPILHGIELVAEKYPKVVSFKVVG